MLVSEKSPPFCPHRPGCDGCPFFETPLAEALVWRREKVAEALDRFFDLDSIEVAACRASPRFLGYRTRVKLAAAVDEEGGLRLGLFRAGTHEVVDIPRCPVAHPDLLPVLDAVRRLGSSWGPAKDLLHVDVRWSLLEQRAHLTLVVREQTPSRIFQSFAQGLLLDRPELKGVALRRAQGKTPRALSGDTEPLCGEQVLWESLAGRQFQLSPGAFFQVNPGAAEILHEIVREFLFDPTAGQAQQVLDLYAGVGTFALSLARQGVQTTAVESVPAAVEDARASARRAGHKVDIQVSTVEDYAVRLEKARLDRVVLDPPRRGLPMPVLAAIGRARPRRLAYVACDPLTAARDLDVLRVFSLVPIKAAPVDMFGFTGEIETVFCVERACAPWSPDIALHENDLVVALKPAVLPTHPQGEHGLNLRDAVRQATGVMDLQPAHRLDVGTSGPVAFGRGETLSFLGRSFENGQVSKEYLALVRGVPRRKGTIRVDGLNGGQEVSRYERLDVVGGYGLVKVRPVSGKRHQIRRHLARIGHPIVGDERYGDRRANRYLAEQGALGRLFLHLHRLELPSPSGEEILSIEAPLPPELVLVLDKLSLRRWG
jgi:23S rRNA (uracil1939-C5)-methyltransferase